ncbi:methyl-accepting chemotaxis protein [Treponema sp.]|uniref:methyl-accepting chemotaxis protein n=1 Tax=Treponema sp. TaxID=166 RepID=UPI00298D6153|nr:methyl-accepting chemotaxis protein [Treponema sp.]MCQ2240492.1 methyl-accepting chemotaxis protein [Treponema sp.]
MEEKIVNRKKSFEIEMMDTGRLKNLVCGTVFFAYTFYSSGIMRMMSSTDIMIFVCTIAFVAIIAQFVVAPYTNRFLTRDISDRISKNNEGLLDTDGRTVLVRDLLSLPRAISIEVILVVLGASITPIIILLLKHHINANTFIHVLLCCAGGLYVSGISAFCYSEELCCKVATKLIEQGINKSTVHKDKFYGTSTKKRILYFAIIPIILSSLLQCTILNISLFEGWETTRALRHIIFVVTCNALVSIMVAHRLHRILTVNTKKITDVLEKLTDHKKNLFLPTDLNHELSYSIFLIDELINYLRDISLEAATTGEEIFSSSQKLSKDANITAETSISEAAAIRECLATMENAKNQHKRISSHIDLIQKSAATTKKSADTSSSLLKAGIQKMSEITQSNMDTIYGIKELSERVESISTAIDAIDAVAERTKTIAFNAELEASMVGEQGEKFHIVANEILRLAASIKTSNYEIKQKITDILHSCDNLIISSESGTQKTREGSEFYSKLESNFKELCLSSDITAESLRKVVDITDIQQGAFEQVNSILAEINTGFENFSQSSQKISIETKALNESAANLGYSDKMTNGRKK